MIRGWDDFERYLLNHSHEAAEVRLIESLVEPSMNAIDVGANVGVTTMALSRGTGMHGQVFAFEPLPRYFRILEYNLAENRVPNAKAFRLALTDWRGKVEFYDRDFSSGIVWAEGAPQIEVPTTTIDDFVDEGRLDRLELIAMDCEGSELMALKGAEQTLRLNSLKILCEIHHGFLSSLGQSVRDIVEYLKGLDYRVQALSGMEMECAEGIDEAEYILAWK